MKSCGQPAVTGPGIQLQPCGKKNLSKASTLSPSLQEFHTDPSSAVLLQLMLLQNLMVQKKSDPLIFLMFLQCELGSASVACFCSMQPQVRLPKQQDLLQGVLIHTIDKIVLDASETFTRTEVLSSCPQRSLSIYSLGFFKTFCLGSKAQNPCHSWPWNLVNSPWAVVHLPRK